MKITILIIFIFLIRIVPGLPQAADRQNKNGNTDAPKITFAETEYDFGTIDSRGNAVHYFVFSNTGRVPLVILNVRTSCGCTVPTWPKAPEATNARDSLRVEYNTKVKGTFNKIITVQSNAENAAVELKIKGTVVKAK